MVKPKTPIGGYAPYRPGPAAISLLAIAGICIAVWAVLGFISWNWNLARWSEVDRASAAFIALGASCCAMIPIWSR